MARNFDRVDDKIRVSGSRMASSDSTKAGWFNPDTVVATADNDVAWGNPKQALDTGNEWAYLISGTGSSQCAVGFKINGGTSRLETVTTIGSGTWNHIAWTRSGGLNGAYNIYINGTLAASGLYSGLQIDANNTQWYEIGALSQFANYFFDGSIAEFAMWTSALTSDQISQLSNGICPSDVANEALVAYWPIWGYDSPEPDVWMSGLPGTLTGTTAVQHPVNIADMGWRSIGRFQRRR